MSISAINGVNTYSSITKSAAAAQAPTTAQAAIRTQMKGLPVAFMGKDLVSKASFAGAVPATSQGGGAQSVGEVRIVAGVPYTGKSYDVQALGKNPIKLRLVTEENVEDLRKYIDIWKRNGETEATQAGKLSQSELEKKLAGRRLNVQVGESFQYYGLMPIDDPSVTHDADVLEYARKNGLIVKKDGKEYFKNCYNGDRAIIESTYTKDGKFLSEIGGLKGTMHAIQVKDMKVAIVAPGTKVASLEDLNRLGKSERELFDNLMKRVHSEKDLLDSNLSEEEKKLIGKIQFKTVGEGDVLCCAVKKKKALNDWFIKPASEFLNTAKANPEKGNVEFLKSLGEYVKQTAKKADYWAKIVLKYCK